MDISARISGQPIYFFSFRESACKTEREVLEGETVWDLKYKNLNHGLRELAGQPRGLLFHLILAVRCSFTGDTWPQSKIQPEAQSSHKKELPLQTCKCRGATRQAGGGGGCWGDEKWPLGGRSIDDARGVKNLQGTAGAVWRGKWPKWQFSEVRGWANKREEIHLPSSSEKPGWRSILRKILGMLL